MILQTYQTRWNHCAAQWRETAVIFPKKRDFSIAFSKFWETSEPKNGIILTTYINMSFQQISDVITELKVKGSAKGVSRSAIKVKPPT